MKAKVTGKVSRVLWSIENNIGYCYIDFKDRHPELTCEGSGEGYRSYYFSRSDVENYASVELIAENRFEQEILTRTSYHLNSKDYFQFVFPPTELENNFKSLYDNDIE